MVKYVQNQIYCSGGWFKELSGITFSVSNFSPIDVIADYDMTPLYGTIEHSGRK